MIRFTCPSCKSVLVAKDEQAKTAVACSKCRSRLIVPDLAASVQATLPVKAPAPPSLPPTPSERTAPTPQIPATPKSNAPAKEPPPRKRKAPPAERSLMPWILGGAGAAVCLLFCCSGGLGLAWWMRSSPEDSAVKAADQQPVKVAQGDNPRKQPAAKSGDKEHASARPGKGEKLNGQQIYDRLLKSTVWIHNPRSGWGTGVLINEEKKLVLTNFHVVARGTPNGEEILDFFWDKLSDGDALDNDAKPFKTYDFDFVRGKTYFIDLYSADFMGQLQVKDAGGRVLATEDLKASNQAARTLTFRSPADGSYQVVAKSADRRFGEFTLQVNVQIFQVKGKNKTVPQVPSAPAPLVYAHFPEFANGTVIAEKMHYVQQNKAAPDKFKADVVAYSEAKDLAVMRLSSLPQGIAPLPLSRESAKPGQAVHSIGNPGRSGALWVYTSGTVRTAPYHKKWQSGGAGEIMLHDALIIETQSPTNPGDSGGPLVNEAGELVAVTQGLSVGANSINLFIDVGDVRNFLQSYNLKWTE